ncbi:hypothetical protein EDD18DRAFT_1162964 [Armillaria luteobubalina]|uniref:Uncharacterized protein n=1 Tax=Armillaria luteobubalina TaxID=153913 RepID=A0AA39Q7E7_9AGAR|nr:hypothetical protein EDD18DRAFT_1162964 [Armillaria luteobubalina]
MVDIQLAVEDPNSPTWLPTPHAVVTKCHQHGPGPSGFVEYSPDFVDPFPDCTKSAWIKYGPSIAMGEARTQDFIANIVNSDKDCVVRVPHVYFAFRYDRIGYIIMQHIHGRDCNEDDFNEISRAVKRLLSIQSETKSPGPVRGGPVAHRFFADHRPDIRYNSVGELQEQRTRAQINGSDHGSGPDFSYIAQSCTGLRILGCQYPLRPKASSSNYV